jgi:transcriptional regulator with XRE-family HTH domain
MSGLYRTKSIGTLPPSLGEQLRALRQAANKPGWEVAAAAKMDSGLLSKIENGKRLPTPAQLVAFASLFGVPHAPLEARRVAEDMKRRYGGHPDFVAAAAAILRESGGEYRVKKTSVAVNKSGPPVNKREKLK